MTDASNLDLSEVEQFLIFDSVPNELINGFRLSEFERKVGSSLNGYTNLSKELRRDVKRRNQLSTDEAAVLRNALDAVLQELGEGEFQTRTGIDYPDGCKLLERFDTYLHAGQRHADHSL